MTPDKRLDQLEPLVADVLQKVDRLIEGQGQLFELVTSTRDDLKQVRRTGDITANGLANLTSYMQAGLTDIRQQMTTVQTTQDLILQILREKLP